MEMSDAPDWCPGCERIVPQRPERIIGIELCWDCVARMRMDAARILREMEWEQLLRAATLTLGH